MMETITALYKQTIYASNDSLYKVALVETSSGEEITISGSFMPLEEGLNYLFQGSYKNHPKYGLQFVVEEVSKAVNSKLGLINYFASDKFPGIGKKIATEIVEKVGEEAPTEILKHPELLEGIPSLTKAKRQVLLEILKSTNELDTIYVELFKYGMTERMVYKLVEKYGHDTMAIIKENPYRLIYELNGFGFLRSDRIALAIGFKEDDPIRVREAILYNLENTCYGLGNTFITEMDLVNSTMQMLKFKQEDLMFKSIDELVLASRLIKQENRIYPLNLYRAEETVARRLLEIKKGQSKKSFSKDKIKKACEYAAQKLKINYTPLQKEVLENIFLEKISIITGGPGTGKTTLVKGILEVYSFLENKDLDSEGLAILLVAPTGKAAKRLRESTRYDASTLHKALGYDYTGHFCFDEHNKLPYQLIIVDEASMIDIELAANFLRAVPAGARIIFIGDENQLPSVGPGEFLHDIIAANIFHVFRLKEVMRQVADSNIIKLANMVLQQKIEETVFNTKKEVFYYRALASNFFDRLTPILDAYINKVGGNFENLQILIPMYAGQAGIDATNEFIQKKYNPNQAEKLIYGNRMFLVGDKVLQLQNDPEKGIMNGDTGFIVEIKNENKQETVLVDFGQKIVKLERKDLENLTLAYAISIHKSQGSEYENVIMPIFSSYQIMLKKKLIYTGITRAKQKLILFGDLNLLASNIVLKEKLRNTALMRLLAFEQPTGKTKIADPISAFSTLEEDLGGLTPYDFLS